MLTLKKLSLLIIFASSLILALPFDLHAFSPDKAQSLQQNLTDYTAILDSAREKLNQQNISESELTFYISKVRVSEQKVSQEYIHLERDLKSLQTSLNQVRETGLDIQKIRADESSPLHESITKLYRNIENTTEMMLTSKLFISRANELLNDLYAKKLNMSHAAMFQHNIPLYEISAWVGGWNDIRLTICDIYNARTSALQMLASESNLFSYKFNLVLFAILISVIGYLYYLLNKYIWPKIDRRIFASEFLSKLDAEATYSDILKTRNYVCILIFIKKAVVPSIFLFLTIRGFARIFGIVSVGNSLLEMFWNLYTSVIFIFIFHTLFKIIFDPRLKFLPDAFTKSSKFRFRFLLLIYQTALLYLLNDINILEITNHNIYPIFALNGTAIANFFLSLTMSYNIFVMSPKILQYIKENHDTLKYYKILVYAVKTVVFCAIAMPVAVFFGSSNLNSILMMDVFQSIWMLLLFRSLYSLLGNLHPIITRNIISYFYRHSLDDIDAKKTIIETKTPIFNYWVNFVLLFFMIVSSILLLLIIWGVPAELVVISLDTIFFKGIPLGSGSNIFPLFNIIKALFLCFLIYYIFKGIQKVFENKILPYTSADSGTKKAIITTIGYIGIVLAVVIFVFALGVSLTALTFIVSGLSVGVGFALQEFIKNFFAGFVLLIERPFKIGDWLTYKGEIAEVKKIRIRSTEIMTFTNVIMIVPNSELVNNTVVNETASPVTRVDVSVGVTYSVSPEKVIPVLHEAIKMTKDIFKKPEPFIWVTNFADSSINYDIKAYAKRQIKATVASNLRRNIYLKLEEAGMEIPFPQRTLHIKGITDKATETPKQEEHKDIQSETKVSGKHLKHL